MLCRFGMQLATVTKHILVGAVLKILLPLVVAVHFDTMVWLAEQTQFHDGSWERL
jgi:hypothetical protein